MVWAAEQLVGLSDDVRSPEPPAAMFSCERPSSKKSSRKKETESAELSMMVVEDKDDDEDIFLLAKTYFDMKEYRRAAQILNGVSGKKSLFLRCYSTYLAGEKRKEEEIIETTGPLGRSDAINPELAGLEQELGRLHAKRSLDPFATYLYGVILHELDRKAEARAALCMSVNSYPWNWSAWLELQSLCSDNDNLSTLDLHDHWMRDFFVAAFYLELQRNTEGLECYRSLHSVFQNSDYVLCQIATAHYNLREFDEAESLFEELLRTDPYRLEGIDIYSNILFVKECFAALSHLAHKAFLTDKYRPETCFIIGNYYSLKAQHEKAVLYFRRALKLNRKYLSAWTLMGHEYVEMKNSAAAIDAYRRAVDINPRDYRAWYGLGQAYELLAMPYYALYYYRKATQLRPHDARMWCAMGQCYENENLKMHMAAIRCYRRAVSNNDREGIALHKLARLHNQLGHTDQAAFYYKKNLERMENDQTEGSDIIEALLFLAQHYRNQNLLVEAEQYCTRLLDYGGREKEDAKALLRDIRSVQQHASSQSSMDFENFTP